MYTFDRLKILKYVIGNNNIKLNIKHIHTSQIEILGKEADIVLDIVVAVHACNNDDIT